ncbi:cell wall-active antibiotics response protein LiaF [Bacillus yapensis]|nr:cell wall-active antibiotics response protein LiaF [Bacillus yapensis]
MFKKWKTKSKLYFKRGLSFYIEYRKLGIERKGIAMKSRSINQILFALFLLAVGVVLLLINIGVISLEIKELFVVFYPFLLLFIGISMFFKRLFSRRKDSISFSFFLMLFATMLVLDRLNYISFGFWDIWKLWPAIIILMALSMLFQKKTIKIHITRDRSKTGLDIEQDEEYKGHRKGSSLSIGDISFKDSNWALEPLELSNSVGDYYIDFSKAFIPEKETPVVVRGWIGDVKMIIPEDIPVKIHSKISVGDIRIFDQKTDSFNRILDYKTLGYEEATRKLNIIIDLKIGSIRIDKV